MTSKMKWLVFTKEFSETKAWQNGFKMEKAGPGWVAPLVAAPSHAAKKKGAVPIPRQGTHLRCGFSPQSGPYKRQPISMSLSYTGVSLSPSSPLSEIHTHILG